MLLVVAFGALSGSLSSLLLQPLDRLKTLAQQNVGAGTDPFKNIRNVIQRHGFIDLWRGTTPTLLRVVPGVIVYFTCLEIGQNVVQSAGNANLTNFLLGSLSRAVASSLLMPATIIKTRFESSLYRDAGMKVAARELFLQHGIRGLYRGLLPTLMRDVPFSGLYIVLYRKNLSVFQKDFSAHAPLERFISGTIAGFCACVITQPFDMMKTYLQLYSQHSFRGAMSNLYQRRGLPTFFYGFWLRAVRRTFMAAVSWIFFDELHVIAEQRQHERG